MNHWEEIKADMLFNKERFTAPNGNIYTATAEPTITGIQGKEIVHLPCRTNTGTHRTLRLPLGTIIKVEKTR